MRHCNFSIRDRKNGGNYHYYLIAVIYAVGLLLALDAPATEIGIYDVGSKHYVAFIDTNSVQAFEITEELKQNNEAAILQIGKCRCGKRASEEVERVIKAR